MRLIALPAGNVLGLDVFLGNTQGFEGAYDLSDFGVRLGPGLVNIRILSGDGSGDFDNVRSGFGSALGLDGDCFGGF